MLPGGSGGSSGGGGDGGGEVGGGFGGKALEDDKTATSLALMLREAAIADSVRAETTLCARLRTLVSAVSAGVRLMWTAAVIEVMVELTLESTTESPSA